MEFFKQNTSIDFMAKRQWAAIFSVLICGVSLAILTINGLRWGLEFTGGTEVQVQFEQAADLPSIREKMLAQGFQDVIVQTYGPTTNAMIRLSGDQDLHEKTINAQVQAVLPSAKILSVNYIGPQVGKELATDGALALFVALLGTAIYIALRFEYRFAISAMVALVHDPIVILGVFSLFQLEFDLISLAAILTVIGYSLNDTIVVFDRVRENFRRLRKSTAAEVVNLSVNQTLSRTIMTSGLTLFAVVSLFFFGGEALHGFATALIIGIIIGTYSSIYVAGALAVKLGLSRQDMLPSAAQNDEQLP